MIGPTIKIDKTCFNCQYCHSERYQVQGDSGHDVTCLHPDIKEGFGYNYIGDSKWNTPDWCPVTGIMDRIKNFENIICEMNRGR